MPLIPLLVPIIVCGLVIYLILQIKMLQPFRSAIIIIATVFLVLYVLQAFGINTGLPKVCLLKC